MNDALAVRDWRLCTKKSEHPRNKFNDVVLRIAVLFIPFGGSSEGKKHFSSFIMLSALHLSLPGPVALCAM